VRAAPPYESGEELLFLWKFISGHGKLVGKEKIEKITAILYYI